MKKLNILYWTSTILFAVFIGMTAIQNIVGTKESIDLIVTALGYPLYMVPFLGVAKLLGALGILVPVVPPRLREWAYAGLFFDLIGAMYSNVAAQGFDPMILTMIVPFGLMGISYGAYHKRLMVQGN